MILELQKIRNKIDYSADQSFNDDFLEDIRKKRVSYIKAAQDNDFIDGLENLLTRLYPDTAHFVYELLQNAEDANATKVYFSLQEGCLYFLHNGSKTFSIDDINSITSIGQSQKLEDTNKIGKFGVGFKSVFSYTDTPSVHSSSISFLIKDMLMPSKLASEEIPGQYTTLFIFPFNNPDKPQRKAYDEVFRLFKKLSNNTLLFLNSIHEVNWSVDEQNCNSIKRKARGDYVEICSTSEDSSYWYIFTKNINIKVDNKSNDFDVKIAYAFDKDKKSIIETRGGVSIFFPADSEVSELKFHIHAPFSSTVARDSIVKDNAENQQLIKGIAELCCESLYELKNNKMLDTSFFAVLPNEGDGLSETYLPIYERIIEEFEGENNDLIPIGDNIFSSLQNCRFARASIKNVFNKNDLKILLNDESIQGFATNTSQINNRTDRFFQSLNRIAFDEDDLINCLDELDNDVTDEEMQDAIYYEDDDRIGEINLKREWLKNKNNEWLQSLYALLFDFSESYYDVSGLTSIIKLSNDSFNFSRDSVYFLDVEQSNSEFKFANQATYLSGKKEKQKQKSKEFLECVGVQNLDESIHIKLLFQNYEFESEEQHIKDIDRLVQFYVDEGNIDSEFNNFSFIYTSKKNIIKPNRIAIDSPFESTGLQYVLTYQDTELLNPVYQNLKNSHTFLDLIKKLGASNALDVKRVLIYDNPNYSDLVRGQGGRQTNRGVHEDWVIKDLESILADESNSYEISKLVWNTMCNLRQRDSVFEARYRCNGEYPINTAKSQLVHILSDWDWIPGKDKEVYNPKNIDKESLSSDFIYNNENGWLDHIEFGLNIQFTSDDRENAEKFVKNITGYSTEQLKKMANTGVSPERLLELAEEEKETQRLRESVDRSQGSGGSKEVDQGDKDNDDEIIIDIGEFEKNIADEYKGMDVQIVDKKVIIKKQNYEQLNSVKEYLYKQYKGHCQICGDTFKKEKDGKHHFVKYSLNRVKKDDIKKKDINRQGNTLSLCPKHHSIFTLGLLNFSFLNVLNESSGNIDIDFIEKSFKFSEYLGRDDYKTKNDAFYALPEEDDFEVDAFLLPIKVFTKTQYLKFTKDHMIHFIKTWNEY